MKLGTVTIEIAYRWAFKTILRIVVSPRVVRRQNIGKEKDDGVYLQ